MSSNWLVEYKRGYLITLINKKRFSKGLYDTIKEEKVDNLIRQTRRKYSLDSLEATNKLINQVRDGEIEIRMKGDKNE